MLFKFLKYVKPTSYFTLKNNKGEYIHPDVQQLPKSILDKLEVDLNYKSIEAQNLDLAHQAIEKGYTGKVSKITPVSDLPLEDEYLFLKKYFSSFWYLHTFLFRLITFNNPIKEIKAFRKGLKGRSNLYEYPLKDENYDTFKSDLVKQEPKVSIVIPTLNRYEYLKDVLQDLEKQVYQNFDVIVVDQSEPFDEKFYQNFDLDIKLIHQEEKALWLARNRAVELSDAKYLLLFDDDSRVEDDWIVKHLKCLDFYKADLSSGVSISLQGAKVPKNYSYFKHSDQLDTGNVLIKRQVFEEIGLFDRQFEKQRMGDGEYGLRAYLHGFVNISNPEAQRLHLKVGTGGLRQMGSWDGFRPKKWFDPRPIPSVLYLFRKYYGNKMAKFSLLVTIPQSLVPYKYKSNKKIIILTYISLIIIWPLVLIQVIKSWKLASVKLEQGAIIKK